MGTINEYKNRFNQLMESTMGNVKPLLNEEENTIINKVASEGLKNLTTDMMVAPLDGRLDGQTIITNFNNVIYKWDCSGIDGVPNWVGTSSYHFGESGFPGSIGIDTIEAYIKGFNLTIEDEKPNTPVIGFGSARFSFILYTTNTGKVKCLGM
jgi:hypothetical protein